ncbi:hypothetical protein BH10CYA1_BH10CYA1_37900 [soil metagenome]
MTHGHGHRRASQHGDSSAGTHHTGDHSSPIHHESTQALSSPGEQADHKAVRPSHPTDHVVITPLGTKSSITDRHMDIPPFNIGLLAKDEVPQKPAGQQHTPGEAAGREAKINGSTSIEDLVKRQGNDAIFVNKQSDANDKLQASEKLKPGETPKISVVYENQTPNADPPAPKPDFIVKKDGTIEVLHNPETNADRNIVVQVERDPGQTGEPTAEQKESLAGLVPYLADRVANSPAYQAINADGRVAIEDNQNLVDDKVEAAIENNASKPPIPDVTQPPAPDVPPEASDASGRMNRVGGSGGGRDSFSPSGDGAISSRDGQAPARDVTPPVQAVEDTISALAGVKDKAHPYDNVANRSDGSYGVGRYSMNQFNIGSWLGGLFGIDLGDPPDPAKLAALLAELKAHPEKMKAAMGKLAQEGKVSKDFASKFDPAKFADFLGKMDGKHGAISAKDVHDNFPKDLQETIAKDRIEHYAKGMGIDTSKDLGEKDAGKLALAMFLGRTPSQADLSNPAYEKYQDTANNMYKLALAGQFGSDRIDVSEANGKVVAAAAGDVGKQLWAQTPWANAVEGGNLGCAASVSKVLQESGVLGRGEGSAGVLELASQLQHKGYQKIPITSMSQFHTGDVVYGSNGAGSGSSHIGIIGEIRDGQVWQYDNSSSKTTWQHRTVQAGGSFVPGGRFGSNLYVLRAPGADNSANN